MSDIRPSGTIDLIGFMCIFVAMLICTIIYIICKLRAESNDEARQTETQGSGNGNYMIFTICLLLD